MHGQAITLLGLAGALVWTGARVPNNEPPDWTLREEIRLGARYGPGGEAPAIMQVTVGRDGAIYVLSQGTGITVFDRMGTVVRRMRIPDSAIVSGLREAAESALARARDNVTRIPEVAPMRPVWSAMGWMGDTLWLIDRSTARAELLEPAGTTVGAIPFARSVDGGHRGTVLALLADRSLLRSVAVEDPRPGATAFPRPAPPDRYRMPIVPGPPLPDEGTPVQGLLVRTKPDGTVLQGLEVFVGPRPSIVIRGPYGSTRFAYPFQDNPFFGASSDGREIVFVERYGATRPEAARYSIARFDVATGKRSARFHEYTPSPITPRTIDSVVTRLVDSAAAAGQRFAYAFPSAVEAKAALRAALDPPAFRAPVTDMVVGADRTVWLQERGTGRWLAHTPDGRITGRVSLPPGARLMYADRDTLWVARPVSDGKPDSRVLVRYRIVRP
jgi:hypothetical protein